ncbi:MAG: SoxR reducing system RseC family protein [Bacillota bacterium]|nr:SoxR reducing system RseC family protein [Bacillota bacterium]
MQQYAFVTKTDGAVAALNIYRSSACGEGCGQNCSICGSVKPIEAYAKNTVGAKIGDRVVIESSSKVILTLAFMMYIFPIIMLVLGYIICTVLGFTENIRAAGAFLLLFAGFTPSFIINQKMKKHKILTYTITNIDN